MIAKASWLILRSIERKSSFLKNTVPISRQAANLCTIIYPSLRQTAVLETRQLIEALFDLLTARPASVHPRRRY